MSSTYDNKGGYAGYNRNNENRQPLDWYATPPDEVTNILNTLNIPKDKELTILEPCAGGGHMVEGIFNYYNEYNIYASDIEVRDTELIQEHLAKGFEYHFGKDYDFLSNTYPIESADIVIMNPPFKELIPFIQKGYEIASKYFICFARTKAIEGIKRYNDIYSKIPPLYMYQYIERVSCSKNGIFPVSSGVEANAWFVWDKTAPSHETILRWMHAYKG